MKKQYTILTSMTALAILAGCSENSVKAVADGTVSLSGITSAALEEVTVTDVEGTEVAEKSTDAEGKYQFTLDESKCKFPLTIQVIVGEDTLTTIVPKPMIGESREIVAHITPLTHFVREQIRAERPELEGLTREEWEAKLREEAPAWILKAREEALEFQEKIQGCTEAIRLQNQETIEVHIARMDSMKLQMDALIEAGELSEDAFILKMDSMAAPILPPPPVPGIMPIPEECEILPPPEGWEPPVRDSISGEIKPMPYPLPPEDSIQAPEIMPLEEPAQ